MQHITRTVLCIFPFVALQIAQTMKDYVVPHAQIAAKYGKPLLTYESGPAITAGSGDFPVQVRRTETQPLPAAAVFVRITLHLHLQHTATCQQPAAQ